MESHLRKSILFDMLDGIPPSGNESKAVLRYRKDIEIIISLWKKK
tara:strand:+ start:217 stop:351 length:135 start_codon:yes stop_codon:yes gene_type:complete